MNGRYHLAGWPFRRNHRKEQPGAGFTIIELLVVLAVIALMAALGFAQLSRARANGRDAKREKEVKTIQDALSIYVNNTNVYPVTDPAGVYLTGTDSVSLLLLSAGAIQSIPRDPQNSGNFRYHYVSENGVSYVLRYSLETNSIPGKSAGQHTAGP